mgnify:CR=1 FL=1
MKLKKGFEVAIQEATLSWKEFKDQFVEFSGNEVELILKFNLPRRCKSKFSYHFSTTKYSLGKEVKRYLPDGFYEEWDGSVKEFKALFFKKYLTQELFEKDPLHIIYLCSGWSSNNGQEGKVPLQIREEYESLQSTVRKLRRTSYQRNSIDYFRTN